MQSYVVRKAAPSLHEPPLRQELGTQAKNPIPLIPEELTHLQRKFIHGPRKCFKRKKIILNLHVAHLLRTE